MFRDAFERILFAARFLLAPLYLALAISLVALLVKSGLHLYELMMQLPTLNDEQVLLSELAIVDLTLTASLVVIVFLSGYTNFVAPVVMRRDDGRPHWIAEIDFTELKLKLMASIVAISAIKLLEGFMNIDHESDRELYWLAGLHLTFVVSTLVLAISDRVSPHTHPSDVDSDGV
ncbi:MAG TPA: YqhA family protein [Roseiarcus sp.]